MPPYLKSTKRRSAGDAFSKPRKSFAGCWTCRKRHLKCDEQRPECLRCQRAALQCDGYSIQLSWVEHDKWTGARPMRPLTLARRCWPVIDSEQIQTDLGATASKHGSARNGLFSAFITAPIDKLRSSLRTGEGQGTPAADTTSLPIMTDTGGTTCTEPDSTGNITTRDADELLPEIDFSSFEFYPTSATAEMQFQTSMHEEFDDEGANSSLIETPFTEIFTATSADLDICTVSELFAADHAPDESSCHLSSQEFLQGPCPVQHHVGRSERESSADHPWKDSQLSDSEDSRPSLPFNIQANFFDNPSVSSLEDLEREHTVECSPSSKQHKGYSAVFSDDVFSEAATDPDVDNSPQPNHEHQIPSHLSGLPRPHRQQKLIHHWVIHLSSWIPAIPNPDNLFTHTFLPLALHGLLEPSDTSTASLALFHAICGVSAAHLASLYSDDPDLLDLSVKHRQLSYCHLRQNIGNLDVQDCPAILATIIVYLIDSSVSEIPWTWRDHIKGGNQILRHTHPQFWMHATSNIHILQAFKTARWLAQLQMFKDKPTPGFDNLDKDLTQMEPLVGISVPLLRKFSTMVSLQDSESATAGMKWDRLELELYMSFPNPEHMPLNSQGELLLRHSQIFHHALLIYCKRSNPRALSCQLEEIAERGVRYLPLLNGCNEARPMLSITWAVMVMASELRTKSLREMVLKWLALRGACGLRSYDILAQMLQTVWEIRDGSECGINTTWCDVYSSRNDFDLLFM